MNCPNCGQPLNGNEPQCPRCGIALQPAASPSPWGQPPASTPYPPAGYPPQPYPPTGQPGGYPPQEVYPQTGYPPTGQPPAYPPSGQYPPQPSPYWTGQPTGQPAPWQGQPTAQPWGTPPTPAPAPSGGRNVILGIVGAVIVVALIIGGVLFVQHNHSGSSTTGVAATATTAATATPSDQVAFQDSLATNTNGWVDDVNCFFANGGYHIKASEACFAPAGEFGDASISVDAKLISGDTTAIHGIVLRRGSAGNFYTFVIDGAGHWDFIKYTSENPTEIASLTNNAAIKTGLNVTNTLKVTAVGSHFTFFVNGTQVGHADDSTYSTGKTGLAGDDSSEVVFNNFTITTPAR